MLLRWVMAPSSAELTQLADRIAQRVGRYLVRQGLLEHDAQYSYLTGECVETDPMNSSAKRGNTSPRCFLGCSYKVRHRHFGMNTT